MSLIRTPESSAELPALVDGPPVRVLTYRGADCRDGLTVTVSADSPDFAGQVPWRQVLSLSWGRGLLAQSAETDLSAGGVSLWIPGDQVEVSVRNESITPGIVLAPVTSPLLVRATACDGKAGAGALPRRTLTRVCPAHGASVEFPVPRFARSYSLFYSGPVASPLVFTVEQLSYDPTVAALVATDLRAWPQAGEVPVAAGATRVRVSNVNIGPPGGGGTLGLIFILGF